MLKLAFKINFWFLKGIYTERNFCGGWNLQSLHHFESLAVFPHFARISASSCDQGPDTGLDGLQCLLCVLLTSQQEYLLVAQQGTLFLITLGYL